MTADRKFFILSLGLITLWLAVLLGIYLGYYQPHFNKAQQIIEQEQKLNQQVAQGGDYNSMVQKIQKNGALVNRELPAKINMPGFLQSVNLMAKESGVEIVDVQPQEEQQEENYVSQLVNIQVQGNFWQILAFIKKIHYQPLLINVNSGQITRSNDIIKSTLGIKLFALPK